MPRFRHVILTGGYGLPGHLAHTRCGHVVAYGRQPNVPRTDPRFCPRCRELDEAHEPEPTSESRRFLSDGDAARLQRLVREQLRLLGELRSRYGWQPSPDERRRVIRSPGDVHALLGPEMEPLEQEQLRVLVLDTRHHVLDVVTLYQGTVDSAPGRIAELFRDAIRQNATAIVLAHQHPSGDPAPSTDDQAFTREAARAAELLGISLLDHVVIGRGSFVSLRERGCLTAAQR